MVRGWVGSEALVLPDNLEYVSRINSLKWSEIMTGGGMDKAKAEMAVLRSECDSYEDALQYVNESVEDIFKYDSRNTRSEIRSFCEKHLRLLFGLKS